MRVLLLRPGFRGTDYHLSVDKGVVAARLASRPGWDVTLASDTSARPPAGVRGVAYRGGAIASLGLIARCAPSTDVLQLLHFDRGSVIRALVYKACNPRGVCYVRLGNGSAPRRETLARFARSLRSGWLFRIGLEVIDLVSAETREGADSFRRLAERHRVRRVPQTILVPGCGFDVDLVRRRGEHAPNSGSDILFVGRVGHPLKATDVLLEAFRRLRDEVGVPATLDLVGPPHSEFEQMLERWNARATPATRSALSVTGPLWDRAALIDRYLAAKVFVICSLSEGIPNVFVEAASCGCLLIGTPVGLVPEVIRLLGGWQVPVGDAGALAAALAEAMSTPYSADVRTRRIEAFSREYSWSAVVDRLANRLSALHAAKRGSRLAGRRRPKAG